LEIIIRPYKDHDFETLEKIRNDFELQYLLMANPKPNTKARVLQWIENKTAGENSVFFVISNEHDDSIGYVQAVEIDLLNRNCYLGIAILEKWRGRRIFNSAIKLIEDYLKNTYNINKVIAEILTSNTNSIESFKKNKYQVVGALKSHFYYKNDFHDVCIYEKLL
jgi:RimJ/RimL family protein N-acetyltransferase